MRIGKRILAILLTVALCMTQDTAISAAAQQVQEQAKGQSVTADINEQTADQQQEEQIEGITDEAKIEYAVLDKANLEIPDKQSVLVGTDRDVEGAELILQRKGSSDEIRQACVREKEDGYLFEMEYTDDTQRGVYEVRAFVYRDDEQKEHRVDFATIGMEMSYGVDTTVLVEADDYVVDAQSNPGPQAEIVTVDDNGEQTPVANLDEAIASARAQSKGEDATGASTVVVVLDPGHGGSDGGAQGNGLSEKNLNLTIALACRAELQTYDGVKVYMTRENDVYVDLDARTTYAQSVGANVFVSIHNNVAGPSASGAMVFYPNGSYRPELGAQGRELSAKILDQLVALGLRNNGLQIRNSESGDRYEDGSLCDYYAVIRGSKKKGFPGIIIEHAFITNTSDAVNYLGSPDRLRRLGVADATGIAQYFGLHKSVGLATPSFTSVKATENNKVELVWTGISYAEKYQIFRRKKEENTYRKIKTIVADHNDYVDEKVKPGETYYYKVRAGKITGSEMKYTPSSKAAIVDTIRDVKCVSAGTVDDHTIELTWERNKNATGYQIFRREKGGSSKQIAEISKNTILSYRDTEAKSGIVYYYKVRAIRKAHGRVSRSSASNQKSAQVLDRPMFTTNNRKNETTAELKWTRVMRADGYYIERSTTEDGTYARIAEIKDCSKNTFVDKGLQTGQTYWYRICAHRKTGSFMENSGYTDPVSVATMPITGILTVNTTEGVYLSWSKVSGATGYFITRSTEKGKGYKRIATLNKNSLNMFNDTTVEPGITYYYKIGAYKKSGKVTSKGIMSDVVEDTYARTQEDLKVEPTKIKGISNSKSKELTVRWDQNKNVDGYVLYRSTSKEGTYAKIKTISKNTTVGYTDKDLDVYKRYYYKVRTFRTISGIRFYSEDSKVVSAKTGYTIMGNTTVTIDQMVRFYEKSGRFYPEDFYKKKGAATLQDFCRIVCEEAKKEGVRAEVVWSQICKETGYLGYVNCDVRRSQCNFGGLGATGNGERGLTFKNVRTGVRAQVQHLKAYGSNENLKYTCVDPRFQYVSRNNAPIVEYLGIQENPSGKGWAAETNYGYHLVEMINRIKECN